MVEELDCAIVINHDEQYQIATKHVLSLIRKKLFSVSLKLL